MFKFTKEYGNTMGYFQSLFLETFYAYGKNSKALKVFCMNFFLSASYKTNNKISTLNAGSEFYSG